MPKTEKPSRQYIAVKALIQDGHGRVLVLRQSDDTISNYGKYHPPGGIVEPGESLKSSLIREVKEEIGVICSVAELFDVGEWYAQREDEVMQFIGLYYLCSIREYEFILEKAEANMAAWVSLDTIGSYDILDPAKSVILKLLKQGLGRKKMSKHVIVYSHGLGVRKDDRGLFTDIANVITEAENVMFDYNIADEQASTLTVSPLQDQVAKLKSQLASVPLGATVDIVAHSQGCLVAALAKPQNVRKILCLAPPDNTDINRLVGYFSGRAGAAIDVAGVSRIPRRDGSTTLIPAAYWQSLKGIDVTQLYADLAGLAEVTFVVAEDDEVLGATNFDKVDARIGLIKLDSNHDFTDGARQPLVSIVKNELIND